MDLTPRPMFMVDDKGHIVHANQKAQKDILTCFSCSLQRAEPFFQLFTLTPAIISPENWLKELSVGCGSTTYQLACELYGACYFELDVLPNIEEGLHLVVFIDVTRYKQVELDLEAERKRSYAAFENAPNPTWTADYSEVKQLIDAALPKGLSNVAEEIIARPDLLQACAKAVKVTDVNQAALSYSQLESKQAVINNTLKFFNGHVQEKFSVLLAAVYNKERYAEVEVELPNLRDGASKNVLLCWAVSPDSEDTLKHVTVCGVNISTAKAAQKSLQHEVNKRTNELTQRNQQLQKEIQERETIETDLRASEERFRVLAEVIPVGIFQNNGKGETFYFNESLRGMLDLPSALIPRAEWEPMLHPEDRERVVNIWDHFLANEVVFNDDYRFVRADGKVVWVNGRAVVERDETGGPGLVTGSLTDITELMETQEQLRMSQQQIAQMNRATIIGEIGSGIAHELSQPLTAIITYSGGCLARLEQAKVDPAVIDVCRKVMCQAERAGAILQSLKNFLRKRACDKKSENLNEVVCKVSELAKVELRYDKMDLVLSLQPTLPKVQVDRVHIIQVLLNLIQNAMDAMEDAGSAKREVRITTCFVQQSNFVTIEVSDTGPGIPEELLTDQHLLMPFVTTKRKGMGIGLSLCKSLIEDGHGGQLLVKSPAGEGAHFTIQLPID